MNTYHLETSVHDPIHGYIPYVDLGDGAEVCERDILHHPWVQRLRHIHQLQSAWWVYPSAEHSRYPHVIGVMHLASRWVEHLYPSLKSVCSDVPSRGYIETLMRMAGLLHDVGHGPFGHFFDEHFLHQFSLTHESLGAHIIRDQLGDLLSQLRGNPNSRLADGEQLDVEQIAWIIQRPTSSSDDQQPRWMILLRSLLSGIYTIDNMDFVLRDAYMTGYSQCSYDMDRLMRYTFFSNEGLTLHDRGIPALLRFTAARAELFHNIYYHRRVRAIDLALSDVFEDSIADLFPGDPQQHMQEYLHFTDSSLLTEVATWSAATGSHQSLGRRWDQILHCRIPWKMVCQQTFSFGESASEGSSIFCDADYVESKLRDALPADLQDIELRVDIARYLNRPHSQGESIPQNYYIDSASDCIRPLVTHPLVGQQAVVQRICRVFARDRQHRSAITVALEKLTGQGADDLTNM